MMYDRERPRPPKFLSQFKPQLNLGERQAGRFYAKIIPVGDPTMQFEWRRNGEPSGLCRFYHGWKGHWSTACFFKAMVRGLFAEPFSGNSISVQG